MDELFAHYWYWLLVLNIAVALFAGLVAGLFGVGGGTVIVPLLFYELLWLGVEQRLALMTAISTSLFNMLPVACLSMRRHYVLGSLQPRILSRMALGVFFGAVVGSVVVHWINVSVLLLIFAVFLLFLALNMSLRKPLTIATELPSPLLMQISGMLIGGISVMLGIGGGALLVPWLGAFLVPVKIAIGTASAGGLLVAFPGVVAAVIAGMQAEQTLPYALGYLHLPLALTITPFAMLMAPYGARLSHYLPGLMLKRTFALFLLIVAGRMLFGSF